MLSEKQGKIIGYWRWINCHLIGRHYGRDYVENITTDGGVKLTIGWCQCDRCGHSKIYFTYGS